MTPLINKAVDVLGSWKGPWDAEVIGITSPQGMLAAISAAKVFAIDEAESDTTMARDLVPGYFASTTGFYLPARVCWFEYKAYAPAGDHLVWTGMRSAFLATSDETGGIVVFMVSEVPLAPGLMILPVFGFEKEMERCPTVIEGQPFPIRLPAEDVPQLSGEKLTQGSNFFLELVEMVNMPAGIVRRDEAPTRQFRRRLARAMGRIDFDLQPVTHVTLDLPDLCNRTYGGAA